MISNKLYRQDLGAKKRVEDIIKKVTITIKMMENSNHPCYNDNKEIWNEVKKVQILPSIMNKCNLSYPCNDEDLRERVVLVVADIIETVC